MNIILMGLPGAGKGTQAERIHNTYHLPHISTGDMFRKAAKEGTELGKKAKALMDQGQLVPDDVTNGIVKERLAEEDVKADGFMLDGYPRTINQAETLETTLNDLNLDLGGVIYIDVPEAELKERLTSRVVCSKCKATYNLKFNPPKEEGVCDHCGSTDFYVRDDDKPAVVARRIEDTKALQAPILNFYEEQGKLYKVPGTGNIDEIFGEIKRILDGETGQ